MRHLIAMTFLLLAALPAQAVSESTANNGNLLMQDVPPIPAKIVEDLNRYQNVRSAPFQTFTNDNKSILISTRFGDVSQLHRVDSAAGARHQLTFFDEPIGSVARQPNGEKIAFTMDAGGSEFSQIFILDPATGESHMVTDGLSRNGQLVWNNVGSRLAFQSTKRNGKSNDIWVMDPANYQTPELVLESTDGSWWGASDWSTNNQHLLVQQYVSATDSRIYFVDTKSKEKIMLAGDLESPSVNYSQAFAENDAGIFLITNQFSEFNQLAYKALDGEKIEVISSAINWDVAEFAQTKDRKKAAFTVNRDGLDVLYLLDPKTFKYQEVKDLPTGLITSMKFSDDGRKMGLTLNSAQAPSDSFVLTLGESALDYQQLTRWTFSEVGGLDTSKFAQPELIRYPSFDQRQIPAFVYKPDSKLSKGPHPVIISIHGGPEGQFRPAFRSTFQLWIDKIGAVVIAPNVRGSAGYGKEYINLDNGFNREDSVKDIGALLDWIASQKDLDAARVAVFGGSYGGYMVLASSVHYSHRLKAAVDIVGISNFVTFLENTQDYRRDLRRVEYGDERDPAMRAHLQKISPINSVDKINLPMFVVQGQNDPRVPVTEAEQIVKALRDKNKQVWYMNALNEGHGYRKKENQDVYQQAVVMFFEQFL